MRLSTPVGFAHDVRAGEYGLTCACPNCTEREAKVLAEANARRKALLALDQAMKDLAALPDADSGFWEYREEVEGKLAAANEAWYNARRFILPEERPA